MKMQKMLCLLLAMLMVFSMAACGEDGEKEASKNQSSVGGGNAANGNKPENGSSDTAEPSVEELGPWLVTEEVDYTGCVYRYHYDENGELTSYELYNDNNKKLRDYKVTHSETAAGGKLTEVESKHVNDSEFAKDCEMEYDADGNLIRMSNFLGKKITGNYVYSYDESGNLLSYEAHSEDRKTNEAVYTYEDGRLATASGTTYGGDVTYHYDYTYIYGENGYLCEIRFDRSDVGEGTITLGKDISRNEGGLHVLTHSAHSMQYQNLFGYKAEYDGDGQRDKFTIIFHRWGFEPLYAIPLPAYGSLLTSWDENIGEITYTRLDTYLAEQAGK